MQRNIKKAAVLTAGIVFIVLGLLGLVLPFLQGILFLLIGLLLISVCIPKVRMLLKKHTERHQKISSTIEKIEVWLAKFIGDM
jgi:uncharacterized membrane protein YbaN (DUF454 family)